jgi:alkanesulfonate monooxygenase SsuD/methylene tetrahydromethanopterin reductase-like flavin-dependent oxidoreductase (luciferase family)
VAAARRSDGMALFARLYTLPASSAPMRRLKYYDVMDPFVVLGAAAAVAKTLLLGTGICLIAQRDPIQTAKQVASIDQASGGRFLFGVGNGWNEDEMANRVRRHKLVRERVEAMKVIWTELKA